MSEMNTNISFPVVMHNDLIRSKSNLGLNETKLLRLAIMQIVREDTDFQTYEVGVLDLAEVLGIPKRDVYRDIRKICKNIMQEVVMIGDVNPRNSWKMFHWTSTCQYDKGVLKIKLSDELKPYLIGLKQLYTSYMLGDVMLLKSVHSIRLYELLREQIRQLVFGDRTTEVYIDLDTIRKATNTEDKYSEHSMFYRRVVNAAVNEINNTLWYHVIVEPKKRGRKVIGYTFKVYDKGYWNRLNK